jgi:uncharacterized integral membrane protein (TIGR00698 family)
MSYIQIHSQGGAPKPASDWADWLDSYEGLPAPQTRQPAPPKSTSILISCLERAGESSAGVMLAALLALCAHYLAEWIGRTVLGFEKSPVGAIPVAVLLGAALRNVIGLPAQYEAGLKTCVRFVFRLGIVLLGLRLSLPTVGAIGFKGLPVIVACISTALIVVMLLARGLGLRPAQGYLIAAGTGICGVSAIATAAPVVQATDDEVSYSIACVTLFGMLGMFSFPFFAHWLFAGDHRLAGYLIGTSIHDTAQVAGAALMYRQQFQAPEALDVATVTKLLRNTTLIVVIPLLGFLNRRYAGQGQQQVFRWSQVIPIFVVAYMILAAARSIGDLGSTPFLILSQSSWKQLLSSADVSSGWFLAIAMAAVGLGTDFKRIRSLGWRPMIVGLAATLTVAGVSIAVLTVFPPA